MIKTIPDMSFEIAALAKGATRVAGIDEVGRGPLAGPVVAAAVVLDHDRIPDGLNDSKVLGKMRREALAEEIIACADVSVGMASVAEIDKINILRASHLAMVRAFAGLAQTADLVLVDGNMVPHGMNVVAKPIVKGDARSLSIAAASIVAKVRRDRLMVDLAQHHPGYGWERNAGYPTPEHKARLESHGVTPHHRRSFKPIHNILCREKNISD